MARTMSAQDYPRPVRSRCVGIRARRDARVRGDPSTRRAVSQDPGSQKTVSQDPGLKRWVSQDPRFSKDGETTSPRAVAADRSPFLQCPKIGPPVGQVEAGFRPSHRPVRLTRRRHSRPPPHWSHRRHRARAWTNRAKRSPCRGSLVVAQDFEDHCARLRVRLLARML